MGVSPQAALEIAIAEAFERAIMRNRNGLSSNGIAAHVDLQKARDAARDELLERDLFLCHYLTLTAFERSRSHPLSDRMSAAGVDLRLFSSRASAGIEVAVAVADGRRAAHPFGAVVGLGASQDADVAVAKAVRECVPNVLALLEGVASPPLSAVDLARLRDPGPHDQLRWSFSPLSIDGILPLLNGSSRAMPSEPQGAGEFSYELLHSPGDELGAPPLFVVRCVNEGLQGLFWGAATEDNVNLARLSSFCGRKLSIADINPHLHPLG